jgi:histone arginine demethylase JMJD6
VSTLPAPVPNIATSGVKAGPTIRTGGIDRKFWDRRDRRRYVREYLNSLEPVIVLGAIDHWPARVKWTPSFFKERYGSLEVTVDDKIWKLGDLIDRILNSTPEDPAPYLHNQLVADWPPQLSADISPMPECTRPNYLESRLFPARRALTYVELYIGGTGAAFPVVHYDGWHTHAFLMQLYGTKAYLVFPPDQSRFLYPRAGIEANKSAIPDIENVDLSRFPLYAQAEGKRFELHPGETLFVPAGWWHTARILSTSITVSINGVSSANWSDFRRDYCATFARPLGVKGALVTAYLWVLGGFLSLIDGG